MKKLTLLFYLFSLVFLVGCMAEMDKPDDLEDSEDPSMSSNIFYNWNTMTFTNTSQYNILYNTSNPSKDFKIVSETVNNMVLSDAKIEGYESTIVILDSYATYSGNDLSESLSYTSDELLTKTRAYDIEVNAMDIITYNALKVEIDLVKEKLGGNSFYMTKENYIEARIERDLTTSEVSALEYLQTKFFELQATKKPFLIEDNSFEVLIAFLETELTFTPTEEERITLETAFNIIKSLHDD